MTQELKDKLLNQFEETLKVINKRLDEDTSDLVADCLDHFTDKVGDIFTEAITAMKQKPECSNCGAPVQTDFPDLGSMCDECFEEECK